MGAARARHGAADLARSACPDRRARRTDPEADFAARAYRAGCGPYQAEAGRHRQSLPSIARGRSIAPGEDRKSGGSGKIVLVRVDLGGRATIKKKIRYDHKPKQNQ